jgi:hypothetical protein
MKKKEHSLYTQEQPVRERGASIRKWLFIFFFRRPRHLLLWTYRRFVHDLRWAGHPDAGDSHHQRNENVSGLWSQEDHADGKGQDNQGDTKSHQNLGTDVAPLAAAAQAGRTSIIILVSLCHL